MAETFSIILYVLGSILLIVLIILGIKLIGTMDKIDSLVDNINSKANSLNGLFSMVDYTTNKLSVVSDRIVDAVASLIRKVFKKKEESEEDYE
jgi:uncharacterized protein YoxC